MDAPPDLMEPPAPSDPLRTYRSWASVLFVIVAAVGILAAAVVLGSPTGIRPVVLAVALAPAIVGIGVLIVLVLALDRKAPWAVHAIQPVCIVMALAGLVRSLVAISGGEISIPLEAIGALLVLTRDHRAELLPPLDPSGRRTMLVTVGLLVLAQVLPFLNLPLGS